MSAAAEEPKGSGSPDPQRLTALLQLEASARQAEAVDVLRFLMANETRRLIEYRQGLVLELRGSRQRLATASSLAVVEPDAPFVRWAEAVVAECPPEPGECRELTPSEVSTELQEDWAEFAPPRVLLTDVTPPSGRSRGILWLARDRNWNHSDHVLAKRLTETFGHAWAALEPDHEPHFWEALDARRWAGIAVALILVCLFPVRLTTLAPVEVEARDPFVVAAPIEGVVAKVLVPPNGRVEVGTALFTFEDTTLRNQLAIAERSVQVTRAELRTASQGAFSSREQGSQVALLRNQLELREAERDYAKELMDRVVVKAERSGLLLYSDESDWVGRPVSVGERIMQIADPEALALRIDLPVDDAIVQGEDAEARIFLDAEPLRSHPARVISSSYQATPTPSQTLAYTLKAELTEDVEGIRIGWQGTAKLYGERVPLLFYLLRRPLATARQWIGF